MAQFKKTNSKIYAKTATVFSPDTLYWKKLGVPTLVKEFGAIDYIDFSPVEPYFFAVTASVRVQIYNPITKLVAKNISKFQEGAHGASFRKDGRLLVAGDELGKVRLFDVSTKSILRFFEGHKASVHRTFFTTSGQHVVSYSDDRTVRYWDIATEKHLHTFSEHNDYVRAGCTSPVSSNIILSGGYDRKINMYDTRTQEVVMSLENDHPIESMIFLPSGGIFMSAGGTAINIYDALAGGRKIAQLSQHHKTVTCLQLASGGRRLLSGSLDRHVKVYDVATYQVVHTIDCSNAILSVGISKNDDTLVTGMVDGLIGIYRRDAEKDSEADADQQKPVRQHPRYRHVFESSVVDEEVSEVRFDRLEGYDRMLRKYEYGKALDSVLLKNMQHRWPEKTVALMKELIRRQGLERALNDRSPKQLANVFLFVTKYIGDYRFTPTLVDVANKLFDHYENNLDKYEGTDVDIKIFILAKALRRECQLVQDFLKIQGLLDMIVTAAKTNETPVQDDETHETIDGLDVSTNASKQGIISVD